MLSSVLCRVNSMMIFKRGLIWFWQSRIQEDRNKSSKTRARSALTWGNSASIKKATFKKRHVGNGRGTLMDVITQLLPWVGLSKNTQA